MNDNTKKLLVNQLVWAGIYFGIAIIVALLLDFPYSFLVVLAIIAPLSIYRRRRYMKKMGVSGGSLFNSEGVFGPKGVDYFCMNCGTNHQQAACPNCGSKMKKAGFGS